jgi:hypothetical protein
MKQLLQLTEKGWFWMALALLLYANTLGHEYVIDDQIAVTRNTLTQKGVEGISEIFSHSYLFGYDGREDESYRPLPLTTFALEKSLFDAAPGASHLVQVLLYGLLLVVLFRWLSVVFCESDKHLAVVTCLLFAAHPIHTEVVANVKSRDELMGALFLFTSLLYFHRWQKTKLVTHLVLTLSCFFLAMLSKETSVLGILLFPAVSFVVEKRSFKEVLKDSLPFLSPFVLYFMIRSAVLSDVLITDPIDPVANSLALAGSGGDLLATNFSIFSKYLQLLFFPLHLSWDYSVPQLPIVGFSSLSAILGLLTLVGLLGATVYGVWKRSLLGLGGVIFVSTFALTSNFLFLINCPMGERFMFIPVLGLILMLVWISQQITFSFWTDFSKWLVVVICCLFSLRTFTRNSDWKDNLTIYEAGKEECPRSVKVRFNLATEYLQLGEKEMNNGLRRDWFQKALKEFNAAEKLYPKYSLIYENSGFVYSELGKIGLDQKETRFFFVKGLGQLRKAIDSLGYQKPNLFQNTYFILEQLVKIDSLDNLQWKKELIQKAQVKKSKDQDDYLRICIYSKELGYDSVAVANAILLGSKFDEKAAYELELAEHYFKMQKFDLSFKLVSAYVDQHPGDLSAKSNKGMLLEILGKKKEALVIYEEILKTDPSQTHTKQLYDKLKMTI